MSCLATPLDESMDPTWKRLEKHDIPDLNNVETEQALGYLCQSLESLIQIHDSLPSELDTAAAIVNGEIQRAEVVAPLTPIHENLATPSKDCDSNSISPFNMTAVKTSPEESRPDSPTGKDGSNSNNTNQNTESIIHRRRRRSSALVAEARAIATVIDQASASSDMQELRGRDYSCAVDSDIEWHKSALSKRFWSKTPPNISVWKYLCRIHKYCPGSTAVYLSAAVYIYRLCVVVKAVPLTTLCVHRLVLAALRVASKSIEDVNYAQKRYGLVGGVADTDLYRLEIALLFLLDFDVKVDAVILQQVLVYIANLNDSLNASKDTNQLKRPRSFS